MKAGRASQVAQPAYVAAALEAGAAGYVLESEPVESLAQHIRVVADGGLAISRVFIATAPSPRVVDSCHRRPAEPHLDGERAERAVSNWETQGWRSRVKPKLAAISLAVAVLLGVVPAAMAAGPNATDPAPNGTGISEGPGGPTTPEALGYTTEYAAQKQQFFNDRLNLMLSSTVLLSTTGSLSGWASVHQKTTYNCLPAVGQSILKYNFGSSWVSPSVAAKQGTAAHEAGAITTAMGTTTDGTNDGTAFSWINSQFAAAGSLFRYVATNATSLASFENYVMTEINASMQMLYVRVDLTSTHYAWHQTTPAQHATDAVAFSGSGAYTTIDDPFTHLSGSTCVASPYTSSNDYSCNWSNYSSNEYYLAKDVVRYGLQPMYF